jgi:competence protein ComEA
MSDYPSEVTPAQDTRNRMIVLGILISMILVGGVVLFTTRPQPVEIVVIPPVATSTPLPTVTPAPILVYVSGAVQQPQTTLSLPRGSRVQEAIDAVGGVTADADLNGVNLAGILRDGDQIHVPSLSTPSIVPTPLDHNIVYINSATLEEIDSLPGIGETTAQAILDYREANGRINNLQELDSIDGIGERTLEDIAPFISFE